MDVKKVLTDTYVRIINVETSVEKLRSEQFRTEGKLDALHEITEYINANEGTDLLGLLKHIITLHNKCAKDISEYSASVHKGKKFASYLVGKNSVYFDYTFPLADACDCTISFNTNASVEEPYTEYKLIDNSTLKYIDL